MSNLPPGCSVSDLPGNRQPRKVPLCLLCQEEIDEGERMGHTPVRPQDDGTAECEHHGQVGIEEWEMRDV